ncbi:MAG TPA: UBP-type zinc finger domain-containing protein [Microthrixaceae bacterium]|nr:UBP-type zinc finger domain-containing protein [Microthrixaceae bacterium]
MAAEACEHLGELGEVVPSADGCEDCLRIGGHWVHLRLCVECGHVGCCDKSPNRHATAHWHDRAHPLVRSFEPGEDWWWCYADELFLTVPGAPPAPSHS